MGKLGNADQGVCVNCLEPPRPLATVTIQHIVTNEIDTNAVFGFNKLDARMATLCTT